MLNKNFILRLFEGFSIQRWTDLVRPFELVEMDKAAERMVVAYIIGKYEEQAGKKVEWSWMIYASIFELLKKIALCDIKSPVQRMIKNQFPKEYIKLNEWVLKQYKDIINDNDFFSEFTIYIGRTAGNFPMPENVKLAERILSAAHKFSTLRELQMIECVNEEERLTKIRRDLNEDIQEFLDLRGMQLLVTRQKPFDFLLAIEQLRFQTRWNQTP
ncbi:MAG TPA: hydrolase, partial [Treponema sp.]|nr:hydrolase [Treponema sp.]